jgi:hypothetical protein
MSINTYPNNVDARVKKLIDSCFPLNFEIKHEAANPVDLKLKLKSKSKLKSSLTLKLNLKTIKKYPLKRSTPLLPDVIEEIDYEE